MSKDTQTPALAGPDRPRFLADENDEKLWDVVLAMSAELAATRARLDILERVLAENGALAPDAIERWQPSVEAGTQRARDLQAYTQRLFGTLGEK